MSARQHGHFSDGMLERATIFQTWEVGRVRAVQETSSAQEIFGFGYVTLKSLHSPLALALVPRAVVHPSVERRVLAKIERFVQVRHVLPQFSVVGKPLLEVPVAIRLRDVKLVEWRLAIDAGSRILRVVSRRAVVLVISVLTRFQYHTPPKSLPDSRHLTFMPSLRNRSMAVMPEKPAPITRTSHSMCCSPSLGWTFFVSS